MLLSLGTKCKIVGFELAIYKLWFTDRLCFFVDHFKEFFVKFVNQNFPWFFSFKIWVVNKNCLLLFLIIYFKPWSISVLIAHFSFSLCWIVHKSFNCHSSSIMKELRKIMDLCRVTGENVCIINIFQNIL